VVLFFSCSISLSFLCLKQFVEKRDPHCCRLILRKLSSIVVQNCFTDKAWHRYTIRGVILGVPKIPRPLLLLNVFRCKPDGCLSSWYIFLSPYPFVNKNGFPMPQHPICAARGVSVCAEGSWGSWSSVCCTVLL
jgi:hypothetical protein